MKLRDFCILSVLLGLCCAGNHVTIDYLSPLLTLRIHDFKSGEIHGVDFHYIIKKEFFTVTGTLARDGWQFMTTSVQLNDGDSIVAYADIYNYNGSHVTTEASVLILHKETNEINAHNNAILPPGRLNGAIVFRDDFNSLNTHNWRYEVSMYGGGNGEFEVYSNDHKNTYARNGYLHIHPTLTVDDPRFSAPNFLNTGVMDMKALFGYCTQRANNGCHREGKNGLLPPVMSGKLKSNPTLKYGIVEVRARIPTGDWLWPAIWMMPRSSHYGGWPRSGEIDMMESRGNEGQIGIGSVSSTLHWGTSPSQDKFYMTHGAQHSSNWASQFHVWKLEWSPTHLVTSIDNVRIMYVDPGKSFWDKGHFHGNDIWARGGKMAPFDQDFYMILNVAVGGTNGYFPDNGHYKNKKPWRNHSGKPMADFWYGRKSWLPTWKGENVAMLVDYVEMRQW